MSLLDNFSEALKKRRAATPAGRLDTEIGVEQERGGRYDERADQSRNRFLDVLGGGQDALNESIRSAVSAGMPQLEGALQGAREGALRRGVGIGGLGTSYEGDVFSAFQRNIANAAGGQAMNLYGTRLGGYQNVYDTDTELGEGSRNRYLDLLSGQADRDQAAKNAKRKKFLGIF